MQEIVKSERAKYYIGRVSEMLGDIDIEEMDKVFKASANYLMTIWTNVNKVDRKKRKRIKKHM